jgi:hypothetical protein
LIGNTERKKQLMRTINEFAGTLRNILRSKAIPVRGCGGA